jgi:hypothetical protein
VASPDDSISARNRHAGESRHPDGLLLALLLDSGFRRNDESKATSELSGKPTCRFAWRRPSLAGCVASSASTLIVRALARHDRYVAYDASTIEADAQAIELEEPLIVAELSL